MKGKIVQSVKRLHLRTLLCLLMLVVFLLSSAFSFNVPQRGSLNVTVKLAAGKISAGDEVYVTTQIAVSPLAIQCTRNAAQSDANYDVFICPVNNIEYSPRLATWLNFFMMNENETTSWEPEFTIDPDTRTLTHTASQQWGKPSAPVAKAVVTDVVSRNAATHTLEVSLELWDANNQKVDGRPVVILNGSSTIEFEDDQGNPVGRWARVVAEDGQAIGALRKANWYNGNPSQWLWNVAWGVDFTVYYGFGYYGGKYEMTSKMKEDLTEVSIGYSGLDTKDGVMGAVRLPVTGPYGSTFNWTAEKPELIQIIDSEDPDWKLGIINRPVAGAMQQVGNIYVEAQSGIQMLPGSWHSFAIKPLLWTANDVNLVTGLSPLGSTGDSSATDGDLDTYWVDSSNDATLTLDMGSEQTLHRWVVHHMSAQQLLTSYKLQTSSDAQQWTDQDWVQHNINEVTTRDFITPVQARYVRLQALDTAAQPVQIREFEVWGVRGNYAPTAEQITITGLPKVGTTLSGEYLYQDVEQDPEAGTTYQWYQADDAALTGLAPIAQATSRTYTPDENQLGKYLILRVTPAAASGSSPGQAADSPVFGPLVPANEAPTAEAVKITGLPRVGMTLNGTYAYVDGDGDLEGDSIRQWYQADDVNLSNLRPIAGADSAKLKLTANLVQKYIVYRVTPIAKTGLTTGSSVDSTLFGPIASLKGDANGDGAITPSDILLITRHIQGKVQLTPVQLDALDMNEDGVVDQTDADLLMDVYLGKVV